MSQAWIAEQLAMGGAANVSQQIRRWKTAPNAPKQPPALKMFIKSLSRFEACPYFPVVPLFLNAGGASIGHTA